MLKMKNIILSLIASLIIIGVGATQVMAADLGANSEEINVGDTVEVTVTLKEETGAVDLTLNYDSNAFEYVSVSTGLGLTSKNPNTPGVVKVSAADAENTTKSVTYTFKAKAVTDESTEPFKASGLITESNETLDVDSVSVNVVEKAEEPQQPVEDPTEEPVNQPDLNEPADNNDQKEPTNNDNEKVDEDGNKITKLPQTGISIVSVLAVLAVAGVAVFGIRKLMK